MSTPIARRTTRLWVWSTLALALASITTAVASLPPRRDLRELVRLADVIVLGRMGQTTDSTREPMPRVEAWIRVQEVLHPRALEAESLMVTWKADGVRPSGRLGIWFLKSLRSERFTPVGQGVVLPTSRADVELLLRVRVGVSLHRDSTSLTMGIVNLSDERIELPGIEETETGIRFDPRWRFELRAGTLDKQLPRSMTPTDSLPPLVLRPSGIAFLRLPLHPTLAVQGLVNRMARVLLDGVPVTKWFSSNGTGSILVPSER